MDEYQVDAAAFAEILRDQRATRMKGGIYHLTQIDMAYNTNRIEGSQLSEEQTRYLYETRTVVGEAPVDDVIETGNSFRAFDRMIDNVGKALTVDAIKHYHRILKEGTEDSRRPWFRVGDWKAVPNQVGDVVTTAPEQVAAEIALLLEATPREMTFDDICNFNYRFEAIHPFQDGNGRVGRLIMFGQCLQNDVMPFVVLDELKYFYYRGLAEFASEPGYLRDTFRTCQDRYYERFKRFVPRAE